MSLKEESYLGKMSLSQISTEQILTIGKILSSICQLKTIKRKQGGIDSLMNAITIELCFGCGVRVHVIMEPKVVHTHGL